MTTPPTSPTKPTSPTHIAQVQPHASFFRVSRPNDSPLALPPAAPSPRPPRPSSFASTSSAIQNRLMDALHGAPLTRQLSIPSASDVSSIAVRRMNSGASTGAAPKHSRDPLLPISNPPGTPHRRPSYPLPLSSPPKTPAARARRPTEVAEQSSMGPGKVRSSFEKIFKRGTSADAVPVTRSPREPSSASAREDLEMQQPRVPVSPRDGYFPPQPQAPTSQPQDIPPAPSPSSRRLQFSAIPPHGATPFVPVVSSKTGRPQRNYEGYPSRNTFFLGGHLLTGGDSPIPFIANFIVVLGLAGTWFATTCVWWWKNESPAVAAIGAYLLLITISSMLATAFRDPGILPRDLDPDPPYPAVSPSDGTPRMPFPRDLRVGENIVRVKYCVTCKTYRPPRSSHCKSCDNCIDSCDHHCQWVNNCVGRRNYTSFITFLVASSITLALVIVTAALHLFFLTRRKHISFGVALSDAPGSAVAFSLGIVIIWPVLALMGYHVRLLFLNITTIEQVRNKVHATLVAGPTPPNPFSLGRWYRNVAYLVCRPAGYTWIEASAVKVEDRRLINPGAYDEDSDGE